MFPICLILCVAACARGGWVAISVHMHASVKAALKQRTKAWTAQQKKGFIDMEDMLTKKGAFLEDILVIYQEEIERLSAIAPPSFTRTQSSTRSALLASASTATVVGSGNEVSTIQGELNAAITDAAHYYELYQRSQQEVKQLTEEVTFLRTEQAKATQKATEDFQRALARNQERHEQALRLVVQEGEMDRARMSAVEAELQQFKSERDAMTAEEVMVAQHQIQALEHELSAIRRELSVEHRRVLELDRELASSRKRVVQATDFMKHLDTIGERVLVGMVKEAAMHRRLVNTLLSDEAPAPSVSPGGGASSSAAGAPAEDRTMANRKVSFLGSDEDADAPRTPHAHNTDEVDDFGADGCGSTGDGHRARILSRIQQHLSHQAGGSGAAVASTSSTDRLQQLLQIWEADIEAQQLELAVAARCSRDQHQKQEKITHGKLMESFGHCEVLMQRIQQMDAQQAELKEFYAQERDKALDARDRAIVMVRAVEQSNAKKSVLATVGVQTMRSEVSR